MTKWIIEPATNGYTLSTNYSDMCETKVIVHEEQGESMKHIVSLLYSLLEELGELGSKHDEERVRIIRVNQEGKEIVD